MNIIEQYIYLIPALITFPVWLFLFLKGDAKYKPLLAGLSKEEAGLSDYYFIGFNFMQLIGMDINLLLKDAKENSKKLYQEIGELKGAKLAYYHYVILRGSELTICVNAVVAACMVLAIKRDILVSVVVLLAGLIFAYAKEDDYKSKVKERREKMMLEFPTIVSKLTLLVNSGMILRDAWAKVAYGRDGVLYAEMQKTVEDIENGMLEINAYQDFATRCNTKEIRKFTATIIQNAKKGGGELTRQLRSLSEDTWNNQKNFISMKTDAAKSKLMIPTFIIFIGILVMVMGPMLSSISL